MKIKLWSAEFDKNSVSAFSTLDDFLVENNSKLNTDIKKSIRDHLTELSKNFDKYYPNDESITNEDWIRDPFAAKDLPDHLNFKEKSELIELVTDTSLQSLYKKEELADFWLRRRATHPSISDRALKFIMPFITSYLCEQGFSSMLYVKNK
jgi:hypothetical protein